MIGKKFGTYIVLKQSADMYEVSDGKQVIRLSEADIEAGNWKKGELMYKIAQPEAKKKPAPKKKPATKKKRK